jgi:hypothetical protein
MRIGCAKRVLWDGIHFEILDFKRYPHNCV